MTQLQSLRLQLPSDKAMSDSSGTLTQNRECQGTPNHEAICMRSSGAGCARFVPLRLPVVGCRNYCFRKTKRVSPNSRVRGEKCQRWRTETLFLISEESKPPEMSTQKKAARLFEVGPNAQDASKLAGWLCTQYTRSGVACQHSAGKGNAMEHRIRRENHCRQHSNLPAKSTLHRLLQGNRPWRHDLLRHTNCPGYGFSAARDRLKSL